MPETHKRKSGKKVDLDSTKQLELRLRIVERRDRMLRKHRSEERMVLEEVFDRSTLMTIYELMNKGEIGDIFGAVKAGKESKLFWGKTPNEEEIASHHLSRVQEGDAPLHNGRSEIQENQKGHPVTGLCLGPKRV